MYGRRQPDGQPAAIRWAELAYSYPCRDCDAGPGMNCRTASGYVKSEPHAARVNDIQRCSICAQWVHAEQADAGNVRCPLHGG